MHLRLFVAGLTFPFILGSCALLEIPGQVIRTIISPLRVENEHGKQLDPEKEQMATDAMIALKARQPATDPHDRGLR